jgi:hypothetical protein
LSKSCSSASDVTSVRSTLIATPGSGEVSPVVGAPCCTVGAWVGGGAG